MTKEELIHITDICFNIPVAVRRADDTRTYHEHECEEAKKIVLEMLEQESILDNIRAEIESELVDYVYEEDATYNSGLNKAIEIIDKYKIGK